MTVTDVRKDTESRTLTLTADFAASAQEVWRMWEDPRLLERWWGPPTYPATVVDHDLRPGGRVTYYMTSPEGERYYGGWTVESVEPPSHLAFEDYFADAAGTPETDMPASQSTVSVQERAEGGTRMVIRSTFASLEDMEQLVQMGMDEGISLAVGQIDAILEEQRASA